MWFEILLWSNWTKWNLQRSELHFTWTHVNENNEVNSHRSEILSQSEASNRFEFTSRLNFINFSILLILFNLGMIYVA